MTTSEKIRGYLKQKWYWYFGPNSFFTNNLEINGVESSIYKYYLKFLYENYNEDVELESLYNNYLSYVENKNLKNKKIKIESMNINDFEKHLCDFDLSTYVMFEDNYIPYKYVTSSMAKYYL